MSLNNKNLEQGVNEGLKTSLRSYIESIQLTDSVKASKPIPKEKVESCGQKTRHYKNTNLYGSRVITTEKLKIASIKFALERYDPTYFLTLQLPENLKTENVRMSKKHLRVIMKSFEKKLLGRHWNKRHLKFICFAEHGTSDKLHYHILFNHMHYSEQELYDAINKVIYMQKLPYYCINLKKIDVTTENVVSYCVKEIGFTNDWDAENIITSHDLFDVEYKNPTNLISDVKKVGNDN